jgi:hypothetical protein
VIFYTTDGWTPTSNSTRYLAPITIDRTTTVQAIALVHNCSISRVATATYSLPAAPTSPSAVELLPTRPTAQGTLALRSDARIPLVFSSPVDSRTAQVGDSIALTLTQDLKIGATLFASKGSSATGKVILIDRSRFADLPGEIQFQVDSLNVNGTNIPVHAVDALLAPHIASAPTTVIGGLATAGLSLFFMRGKDARIPAGAQLTATMTAGTLLLFPQNSPATNTDPSRR